LPDDANCLIFTVMLATLRKAFWACIVYSLLLGSFCQRRRYPAFQPWPGPVRSDLVSLPG
jgi:hypothetical protein